MACEPGLNPGPPRGMGPLASSTKSRLLRPECSLTGARSGDLGTAPVQRGLLALRQGVLSCAWGEEPGHGGGLAACGMAEVRHQDAAVELRDSGGLGGQERAVTPSTVMSGKAAPGRGRAGVTPWESVQGTSPR